MWILWKMRLWNCEFCEKWDFQNVTFWMNWGLLPQCVLRPKNTIGLHLMLDGDNSSGKLKPILFSRQFISVSLFFFVSFSYNVVWCAIFSELKVLAEGTRCAVCCYTVKMDLIAKRLDHQLGKKREKNTCRDKLCGTAVKCNTTN